LRPPTKNRRLKRPERSGTILYIALIFIAVINILALAYVKCIPTEANSFLRSYRANVAHYVCEAAINDTLAFLTFELKNGREPTPSGPISRSGTHSGWSWTARITPDPQSPPIGNASLRFWEIMCEAYAPDTTAPARRIRATVGEETFARYTSYTDVFGGVYYNLIGTGTFIEGHLHTNTYISMRVSDERYASSSGPAFLGYVTSAGAAGGVWDHDGVDYFEMSQAPFDSEQNAIPGRYDKIYHGGREGVNTGVDRIEMPETAGGLARRAWGDDTPPPTDYGFHVNVEGGQIKGGYFVVGAVDSLRLGASGGAAVLTMEQADSSGNTTTTVIVEAHEGPGTLPDGTPVPTGSTGILTPEGPQIYDGLPNGLLHTTGTIESLEGTNLGARTISADLETAQKIIITGDLLRADTPPGTRPNGARDVLGLVTYRVEVSRDVPRSSSDPLYLYMSYLAGKAETSYPGGGFVVQDFDDASLGRGVFYIYGSTGAGRTYPTGMGTDIGFGYRHYFDQHAVATPPPFYPTTGKLPIRSWREEDGAL
jgi:hypothetical protein